MKKILAAAVIIVTVFVSCEKREPNYTYFEKNKDTTEQDQTLSKLKGQVRVVSVGYKEVYEVVDRIGTKQVVRIPTVKVVDANGVAVTLIDSSLQSLKPGDVIKW